MLTVCYLENFSHAVAPIMYTTDIHSLPSRSGRHRLGPERAGEAGAHAAVLALQRLRQAGDHLHHHRLALLPRAAFHALREVESKY